MSTRGSATDSANDGAVRGLRLFLRAADAAWGDETAEEIAQDCIIALERGGLAELERVVAAQEAEADE
jgi:hypothetical protein